MSSHDRAAYQIGNKLFADIAAYIDDHYVDAHTDSRRERMRRMGVVENRMLTAYEDAPMATSGLDEALAHLDTGFSETLLKLIDRSGKKDAEVYKKANVDRKLFSKIRNNPDYKPSKPTAVAFAIALELSLPDRAKSVRKSERYQSLPICVLDCVYSLRTKYFAVTVPVLQRYADTYMGGNLYAGQDTLSDFITHIKEFSDCSEFAKTVLKNNQVLKRSK